MTGGDASTGAQLEALDKRFLWHPFTQQQEWEAEPQLVIDRAEGCYLIDAEGRRYLDGVSSLWVNVHGHAREEIDRAIIEQLGRVAHSTFLGLTHGPAIHLARHLIEIAPGRLQRVFYSDAGATAVEVALKMAFHYWRQCPDPQPSKTKFFALHHAYHGDTIGAMSVGAIDLFHNTYAPLFFPTEKAPSAYCYRCHLDKRFPSCGIACLDGVERVISAHADQLAAVIMEPMVQAAGGILVFPPGYTRGVWEIARRHNVLFIADEVATGFGRTGRMFACEHEGVEPDLMVLGKGITGGYLPLAATLATEDIYRAFLGTFEEGRTFYHGHSYTANPLACAAALASLELFGRERTLERIEALISQLSDGLERFRRSPYLGDVRQCGLIAGLELVADRESRTPFPPTARVGTRVAREARKRGAILRPLGDTLVVMPPLSIRPDELDALLSALFESLAAVSLDLAEA